MVDDSLINQQLREELETLWETSIDCWQEYQRPDGSHVEYVGQRTASLIESFNRIRKLVTESYKKGHADGAIEVVNNTCDICGSYPMTTNCNNAGCDA